MKKTMVLLLITIGIVIGALGAAGVYFLTVRDVPWQEYVEGKLIPNAVLAISTIGGLCVAVYPVIGRVTATLSTFKKATQDVNETVERGKATEERIAAQDRMIEDYNKRFDALERYVDEKIETVRMATINTERIVRLGFCNTDEIVRKGYANEIEKVGREDEG